jgi:beta-phosphoglucomutase
MEQHLEAWRHGFSRFEAMVSEEDFFLLEGRGVKSVVDTLVERYNIDSKFKDEIMKSKIDYYNSNFEPIFYDGIYALLDNLKSQNIQLGVVTGGMRDRVNEIIDRYFKNYFSTRITSDDVENTKPFPEPYLKGASMLDLPPEDCIVIENAPMGIKAGKEAGMYVVGITTTLDSKYLKEADVIVNSFDEVNTHLFGI